MSYPVSVSMTPAFYDTHHRLLQAQLRCLKEQTVKDFDVWLIDPHYEKRKWVVPEIAQKFKLDIKHVPYAPNIRIGKVLDCAIFNAAYVYSRSPINVRFSCYRFVRPEFIERILEVPIGVNADFYFHSIGPCLIERSEGKEVFHKHTKVWNDSMDYADWEFVPTKSGKNDRDHYLGDPDLSLADWPIWMDLDSYIQTVPDNLYGNIAWNRDQWLALNGTNEVVTNFVHWEDMDFDVRSGNARQTVKRMSNLLYRLWHHYGAYAQRSNVPVDVPYTKPCGRCGSVHSNTGEEDLERRLKERIDLGEVEVFPDQLAWVCKDCLTSGPVSKLDGKDYWSILRGEKRTQAPIIKKHKIGRNLQILANDMDARSSLDGKIEVFNSSWEDPRYYEN